jgi:NarL family two-component system response regulator LiaR
MTMKLLLVDENTEVAALLAKRLSEVNGFQVVAQTGNPLIAAELAHLWRPNIIIADFNRRGRYGAAMYAWLKKSSPSSALVVLTSFIQNGDEELYKKAGASRCLLKGLSVRDLAKELRAVAGLESEDAA